MHMVVVDNYDSFTFNLVHLLESIGARITVYRNDAIEPNTLVSLDPTAVMISPGPGRPTSAGISLEIARSVPEAGIPLLGVCLGHQCLAQAFGARIIGAKRLVHGKTGPIYHRSENLFEGLPSPFPAARYHSLVVEADSIPSVLEEIAWNDEGEIMALVHRHLPAYGIQFHPESFLTPDGKQIMSNFLRFAQRRGDSR